MYVSIILCKLVNMFVVIDHPLFDHPLTGHWVHPTPNLQPPQGFRSHSGARGRQPARHERCGLGSSGDLWKGDTTNRLYELIMNTIYKIWIYLGICLERLWRPKTFGLVTFSTFHNHPILSVGISAVTHGIASKFHKTTCNHQRWDNVMIML